MSNETRSSFSGKIGFVLAAAGSAVGLGNIWRFPYLAAKYGGGIFLLVYIVLAVTLGFALMTAEIAIGRKTGLSAIGAYKKLDKRFGFLGWMAALVPVIILPYYSVIGGWVAKYLFSFVSGNGAQTAADVATYIDAEGKTQVLSFFENFIGVSHEGMTYAAGFGTVSPWEPIGWFFLFLGVTALIVLFGVEKGIEKVSKIMMPVLVALSIGIAVYVLFLPNAMEGVKYYILPDFSKFSVKTVLAAMGQLFYSMSLAMGIMITYGSYMKKEVNLESSVSQIEIFDTGIAFLAGLMIIPAVFTFSGGTPEALGKGPGLMFAVLPKVFEDMWGGHVIGAIFFILVLVAALTSSISLMETVISMVCDKFRLNRKLSWLVVFAGSIVIGLPSTLGYSVWSHITLLKMPFLDFFDFISNSVLMPIVAFLTCILVGYVVKPAAVAEEVELSSKFKRKALFVLIIKYAAPICILLILVSSVLDAFGLFKI